MMQFLLLESACTPQKIFVGNRMLTFALFFYEGFTFFNVKEYILYHSDIYGTKYSAGVRDVIFSQHVTNMLCLML